MKILVIAFYAFILYLPEALSWDYNKIIDQVEGTHKWSCVYDADHGELPKQLCVVTHVETSTVSMSLSNGTAQICDEVMIAYKVNGGQTFFWDNVIDDETVSLNLVFSDHELAILKFGSRLVMHTLDSCGNASLMDFDISDGLPMKLFDNND